MKNLNIKVIDESNNIIGYTSNSNKDKLIKNKTAKLIDDKTIVINTNKYQEVKTKGLAKIDIPRYALSEELLSAISHGLGVLLSIAALVLCIIYSSIHHNVYAVISSAIYGSMSIILYCMSTLYHSFKVNNAKRFFRIIDHCSIYLLIAGTYTPYALVTLRSAIPSLGWTVFGVIWACAILGITLTSIDMNKFKRFGLFLYIIMGWMIIFTFKVLLNNLNRSGIYLMLGAGIIYTIGAVLYGIGKKVKYIHSLFHFFVLAASILFFFSIFLYVI